MLVKLFKLGLVCFGLLVILFLVGLTLSSDWEAQASATIKASPERIYDDVANLRKWREWSIWNDAADPDCKHSYEGPESGVGARWIWDGPKLLRGNMTITEASVDKGIVYTMEFVGMASATGAVEFNRSGEETEVTLMIKSSFPGVLGGWLAMLVPGSMSAEFQKCVDGLKSRAEARSSGPVDASTKKK